MTRINTKKLQTGLALFAATLLGSGNATAFNMAQTPLFLTGTVEPNIVYMLDDSGSMQFDVMPDDIMSESGGSYGMRYLFPPEENVYGGEFYPYDEIVGTGDDEDLAAYFRSPENNKLYYDPSVDYEPWVRADGSRMPEYDASQAPLYPKEVRDEGSIDLTSVGQLCNSPNFNVDYNSNTVTRNCSSYRTYKYYYPATYYEFTGADTDDRQDADNYDRVQIKKGNGSYPSGRSYSEEIQNFSNWFTYHRSRALAALAGSGAAYAEQGNKIRVGYGTINAENNTVDNEVSDQGMVAGVRQFEGTDREDFFDDLYKTDIPFNSGTPLRKGLEGAGEYYVRDDSQGPWSTTPGAAGGDDYECRSSYTVLMTDGYWSGDSPGVGNVDDTDASDDITNPDPEENKFQYKAVDPFNDDEANTLADVAMKYWNRDLRGDGDMDNEVPATQENPAFWQHMVTYGVGLGVNGRINPDDAFNALPDELGDSGENIDWPERDTRIIVCNRYGNCWYEWIFDDKDKIDDLLHASVNSRGDFFSAQEPDRFASELSDMLSSLIGRSAGSGASVAANSTRLETDSLVFQGRFDSKDWSGDLRAYKLTNEGELGTTAWRAAELLDKRDPDNRTILTTGASGPAYFKWNQLGSGAKNALWDVGNEPESVARARVEYVRGDQSEETKNGGQFRSRDTVLGDVINSRPVFTEDERYGYRSFTTDVGQKYIDFIRDDLQDTTDPQPAMVYVGANDGMLHGFNAKSGKEEVAFVPSRATWNMRDLTDPQYKHRYFVDGSATVGDAYIDTTDDGVDNPEWRRILIGTMGGGGNSVFALDITDPMNMTPDDVLWEFYHDELGKGVKEVSLVRVQTDDGGKKKDPKYRFDVIFGNGYGSDADDSQLFVLDAGTGKLRPEAPIKAGDGTAGDPNGLATPFVVDEDQNQEANLVYAGDLNGNVWRFEFNKGEWQKDYNLFAAENDDGDRQPITSKVDVGFNDNREKVVVFGTGQYLQDGDAGNNTAQDLYGVVDASGGEVDRTDLREQTLESSLTENGREYRIVSSNDYDPATYKGWRVSLDSDDGGAKEGERSVVQPLVRGGVVTFVSIVPSSSPCDAGGESWLTSVNINSGARVAGSFFDVNDDGDIDDDDLVDDPQNKGEVAPTSLKTESGIVDTPTLLSGEDKDTMIVSGSDNEESIQTDSDETTGPQSWRQVR